MSREKKRYWMGVGAVWLVWLAVTGAGWLLVLTPQQAQYAQVHKKLKVGGDEVELARRASLETTRQHQTDALDQLEDEMARYAIDPVWQDRLVFEVSRVASELELSDYAGRIRRDLEKPLRDLKLPVERVFLDVTFRGSFEGFARFMNSLERHRPVLFVENASFERLPDEKGDLHKAELLLSILVQKPREAIASEAASEPTARRTTVEEVPRI